MEEREAKDRRPASYRTVYEGGEGEIVEKRSRFIAHVYHVESEEEAMARIEAIRKQYWDARHNCYAFVIGSGGETARFSDDGEPAQTAGKPILDVICGRQLKDTLIVVTRYFGGTLLGTGGLVRAYTAASLAGIEESIVIEKFLCARLEIRTDYTLLGKIQYHAAGQSAWIRDTVYAEDVTLDLLIPEERLSSFNKKITEATAGRVQAQLKGYCYGADVLGDIMVFDH